MPLILYARNSLNFSPPYQYLFSKLSPRTCCTYRTKEDIFLILTYLLSLSFCYSVTSQQSVVKEMNKLLSIALILTLAVSFCFMRPVHRHWSMVTDPTYACRPWWLRPRLNVLRENVPNRVGIAVRMEYPALRLLPIVWEIRPETRRTPAPNGEAEPGT